MAYRNPNKYCLYCGEKYKPATAWQKFCSRGCRLKYMRREEGFRRAGRHCRQCGEAFEATSNNRQHCSDECSRISAKESRAQFYGKNPQKEQEYRERARRKAGPDSAVDRWFKRYPDVQRRCEACGEHRVVEIAHRPQYKRNGAWKSKENTSREKVWVLCPTCHKIVDYKIKTPKQLGLEV